MDCLEGPYLSLSRKQAFTPPDALYSLAPSPEERLFPRGRPIPRAARTPPAPSPIWGTMNKGRSDCGRCHPVLARKARLSLGCKLPLPRRMPAHRCGESEGRDPSGTGVQGGPPLLRGAPLHPSSVFLAPNTTRRSCENGLFSYFVVPSASGHGGEIARHRAQ